MKRAFPGVEEEIRASQEGESRERPTDALGVVSYLSACWTVTACINVSTKVNLAKELDE